MLINASCKYKIEYYLCRMKTDNLITSGTVAGMLKVSTQRVYAMIKEGKVTPLHIIDKIKFFDRTDIQKIVDAKNK